MVEGFQTWTNGAPVSRLRQACNGPTNPLKTNSLPLGQTQQAFLSPKARLHCQGTSQAWLSLKDGQLLRQSGQFEQDSKVTCKSPALQTTSHIMTLLGANCQIVAPQVKVGQSEAYDVSAELRVKPAPASKNFSRAGFFCCCWGSCGWQQRQLD